MKLRKGSLTALVLSVAVPPGDELGDGVLGHGHHWDGLVGGEPVGPVVPARVVADVIEVTEQEGHCVESVHAGARLACINMMMVMTLARDMFVSVST